MEALKITEKSMEIIKGCQQNEVDEHSIYTAIAASVKNEADRNTLLKIAREELMHAEQWKKYTGEMPSPRKAKVAYYSFLAKVFGYTFAIKLMENGEEIKQQVAVSATSGLIPVCVMAVSAVIMIICGLLMRKPKLKWLSEYALPISLVLGMASAIPITLWLS